MSISLNKNNYILTTFYLFFNEYITIFYLDFNYFITIHNKITRF